jgi:hypothetical protein
MWPDVIPEFLVKVLRLRVRADALHGSVVRGRRVLAHASVQGAGGDAPLALLGTLLATLNAQSSLRGARAEVEIADSLVLLDVVDGDFADHGAPQLEAIATACIAELLGAGGATHEARWQLQGDERHLLIAALPRDLLAGLRDALALHGIRLHSAMPGLCCAWNRHAAQLGEGADVLALAGPGSTTIVCLEGTAIRALGRFACGANSFIATLDAQVNRLRASMGLAAQQDGRYLLVTEGVAVPPALARWTLLAGNAPAGAGSAA